MSFSFHPDAEIELNEAIDYYESIQSGLGYDFATEVHFTIQRSVSLPMAWTVIDGEIRRSLVNRFPYGIFIFKRRKWDLYHCSNESTSPSGLLEK